MNHLSYLDDFYEGVVIMQVPAALVNFKWDPVIMKEIAAAQGQVDENIFLKPEVLCRVQELS